MKQMVANAGHPAVLLDLFERITHKYAKLILEDAATD